MGTVSCKASPVFTFCCIKNNVPKRKDGGKNKKQNKQHSPNKKQQKKNREGLISFMTRVMIGGCKADV